MRSIDRGTVVVGMALWLSVVGGCGGDGSCPAGLVLQSDGRCLAPVDASGRDAGMDAAIDAAIDAPTGQDVGLMDDAHATPDAPGGDVTVRPDVGFDGCVTTTYYQDLDSDAHGNAAVTMDACTMPTGYVASSDDCDDTTAGRHPGLAELCDALDNDCNGTADDTFACVMSATNVACTTSCGSMGRGTCSATCSLPTGAACTPPLEACNNHDDDCDGLIDENVHIFSSRRDLGTGTSGIVALATPTGFVVVYGGGSGIRARTLDTMGTLTGVETMLAPTSVFSAAVSGTNLVVAYMVSGSLTAAVFNASTLTSVTPATTITTATGTTEIRVAATASSVSFVTTDGVALSFVNRSLPTLAGSSGVVSIDTNMRGDFDVAVLATQAFVAYVDTTYNVEVRGFTIGGAITAGVTATLASGGAVWRRPAAEVGSVGGTNRLGITWEHAGGTPSTQHFYFASFDVAGSGMLTAHTTPAALLMGLNAFTPTSAGESRAFDLTYTNSRWWVSLMSGSSSSVWSLVEVNEVAGGINAGTPVQVESTATDNRGVAMVPGTGAQILVGATQTAAAARAYFWACGG